MINHLTALHIVIFGKSFLIENISSYYKLMKVSVLSTRYSLQSHTKRTLKKFLEKCLISPCSNDLSLPIFSTTTHSHKCICIAFISSTVEHSTIMSFFVRLYNRFILMYFFTKLLQFKTSIVHSTILNRQTGIV